MNTDHIETLKKAIEAGEAQKKHESETPKCECCGRPVKANEVVKIHKTGLADICVHKPIDTPSKDSIFSFGGF